MRQSELPLRLLSLAMAAALLFVVHGERRVSYVLTVPVTARFPAGLAPTSPLPSAVRVSVSGPWATLRAIDGVAPVTIDLAGASRGPVSWLIRPELLHLPSGVQVEALDPSQGTVDLRGAP